MADDRRREEDDDVPIEDTAGRRGPRPALGIRNTSEAHQVRFSQDVQQQEVSPIRNENGEGHGGSAEGRQRTARSPLGGGSSLTGLDRAASPRGRDRGYSLRTALFNRSVTQRSDNTRKSGSEQREQVASKVADTNARILQEGNAGAYSQQGTAVVSHGSGKSDAESSGSDPKKEAASKAQGANDLPGLYPTFSSKRSGLEKLQERVSTLQKATAKFVFRRKIIPPSKDGRHITLDASRTQDVVDERTGKPHINNTIRSSRYTLWDFLPRQLIFQFSKLANAYFLIVGILQLIPGLSTIGSWTTIAPLAVFVSLSIAKEGYDDVRRYRLDQVENRKEVSVAVVCASTSIS